MEGKVQESIIIKKEKSQEGDDKRKSVVAESSNKNDVEVPPPPYFHAVHKTDAESELKYSKLRIRLPMKRAHQWNLTPIAGTKRLAQSPPPSNPPQKAPYHSAPNQLNTQLTYPRFHANPITAANRFHVKPSAMKYFAAFNGIIRNLEEIFPCPGTSAFHSGPICKAEQTNFLGAYERFSSLLPLDFNVLIDGKKLSEVVELAKLMQKNATLNANQFLKLKMMENLPMLSKNVMKMKEIAEAEDNICSQHEVDTFKSTFLWDEQRNSVIQMTKYKNEVLSHLENIRMLDKQILHLQSQRYELARMVDMKQRSIQGMISSHKRLIDSFHQVSAELQQTNVKKEELKEKKRLLINHLHEDVTRFAALKGFKL